MYSHKDIRRISELVELRYYCDQVLEGIGSGLLEFRIVAGRYPLNQFMPDTFFAEVKAVLTQRIVSYEVELESLDFDISSIE